jgi:hypothetical protein
MSGASSRRLALFLGNAPLLEDAAVRALAPGARQQLGELWRRRAENELCTSAVFAQLDTELRRFGAPSEVLALSAAAIDDEAFHSELCGLLAEIYQGTPALPPSLAEPRPPVFPVCSPRVHVALFAALHSAINETLAVGYLAACLGEAQSEPVRRVLKELLGDEVRHARIGWAVLASPQLDSADRTIIAALMPALLERCASTWLADNEVLYPADLPLGHGCIDHTAIAHAVNAALKDVIVPGLPHVGVDAGPAQRWLASWSARSATLPAALP